MKIKRFKNKWTMGLLIFSVLLFTFYLLCLISPKFIVGIAEIDAVVKFGNFVDKYKFTYYIFTFWTSFITIYLYCCACCRKPSLNWKEMILVAIDILIMFVVGEILPEYYLNIDMILMIILPTLICFINENEDIKYLYSIVGCFSIHYLAQMLSTRIRNIQAIIKYPNSATFTILLFDGVILLCLLYCFFNYKRQEEIIYG